MARQLELQRELLSTKATYSSLFARDLDFPLQSIFLSLDPVSLKSSRLVCKEWSEFIKRRVWGTTKDSEPNTRLRQRLAYHWIHATPTVKSVVLQNDSHPRGLSCDDSIVVVCFPPDYNVKVYDLVNLNLLAVLDCRPPPTHQPYNGFGAADVGRDVVATVMENGNVFVWRRSDWSPVFKGRPHGDNWVGQVKVLANLIITGGAESKLALLSWDGDQVSLMRMIVDEAPLDNPRPRPITGLDSDGEWLVYGTSCKLSVWNLADNKLAHTYNIQCRSVFQGSSVVLNYPYAVVVKNNGHEVMVIELPTGQLVKSLCGYAAALNHNKSILVGSYPMWKPPGVYICDLRQMTNPQQNGPHWKRRKYLEDGAGAGVVESCVNTSCVVAVQGNKLYVWDFWNCDNFDDTPDGFINDVD